MSKLYTHIEYGFIAFNGVKWSSYGVDSYNRVIDKANRYLREGRQVPDNILNEMNHCFKMESNLYK